MVLAPWGRIHTEVTGISQREGLVGLAASYTAAPEAAARGRQSGSGTDATLVVPVLPAGARFRTLRSDRLVSFRSYSSAGDRVGYDGWPDPWGGPALRAYLIATLATATLLIASTSNGLLPRHWAEQSQVYGAYVLAHLTLIAALVVLLKQRAQPADCS